MISLTTGNTMFPVRYVWNLYVMQVTYFFLSLTSRTYSFFCQCQHMSLMDFVVSPSSCGRSVTEFWGWDPHEAQLRCPDEVDGDIRIWSTGRGLNLSSTKLPRPWSPWESSLLKKNSLGRVRNRTLDLMISSQKLWPLDHEAGRIYSL
jgi:hypothetical protein